MRSHGFSLIELLAVLAIVSTLMALAVGGVHQMSTPSLATGSSIVRSVAERARQTAISRNTLTALVILKDIGEPDASYRLLTVFELVDRAHWRQVDGWQKLPQGITVDPGMESTFLHQIPSAIPFAGVDYRGTPVSEEQIAYQLFLPNGGIATAGWNDPGSAARIRLLTNEKVRSVSDQNRPVSVDVILNSATGIPKVEKM